MAVNGRWQYSDTRFDINISQNLVKFIWNYLVISNLYWLLSGEDGDLVFIFNLDIEKRSTYIFLV